MGNQRCNATGFTNIVDIAFGKQGTLYVLGIAHNSLAADEPEGAPIRVRRDGSHEIVATAFSSPVVLRRASEARGT